MYEKFSIFRWQYAPLIAFILHKNCRIIWLLLTVGIKKSNT